MDYDPATDTYICGNENYLRMYQRGPKEQSLDIDGKVTTYECESCRRCPYKKACIKGNNCKTPFKDRNKRLSIFKKT